MKASREVSSGRRRCLAHHKVVLTEDTFLQRTNSTERCHNLCRQHQQTPGLFESREDLHRRQGTHYEEGRVILVCEGGGGQEERERDGECSQLIIAREMTLKKL